MVETRNLPAEPQESLGRWLVVAAAVLWSTSGFFAKAPLFDQWPAEQRGVLLGFWRAVLAGLVLLPWIGKPVWTWRLVPACLSFAIMNAAFLLAMTSTTAANAIWLQYTAPAWVFLVGTLFLGEPVRQRDIGMMAFAMLGVASILVCEWTLGESTGTDRVGSAWGLVSGVSFAGVMLSLRQLRDLSGFWVISVCHLAAALLLAPLVLPHASMWPSAGTALWLAAFGTLQMAVPYLLFARGLRHISGHEASCITLLEPLLVPAWVFVVWRHAPGYRFPDWWTWLGATFILAGLAMRYGGAWWESHRTARRMVRDNSPL